jgi:hypothetical protein
VAGLVLLEDVGEEYPTEEDSVKRLKQRAVEAGPDLILPPVAFQEFVGIKEDELEATPTAFRVELSSPLVIDPKRDREAYSVVEVSGRIGGAEHLPKDAHLLLASNGVVASILPLIEWPEGEHHFLGVLPKRPESLDQLSFYLVWREGKRTRVLKPLPSS